MTPPIPGGVLRVLLWHPSGCTTTLGSTQEYFRGVKGGRCV